jgi:hypothetical protein
MELPADRFVFSPKLHIPPNTWGRAATIRPTCSSHFARNTCLIIGCSLEDELRNVLMRGAEINPGNYHYYVHYVESDEDHGTECGAAGANRRNQLSTSTTSSRCF